MVLIFIYKDMKNFVKKLTPRQKLTYIKCVMRKNEYPSVIYNRGIHHIS